MCFPISLFRLYSVFPFPVFFFYSSVFHSWNFIITLAEEMDRCLYVWFTRLITFTRLTNGGHVLRFTRKSRNTTNMWIGLGETSCVGKHACYPVRQAMRERTGREGLVRGRAKNMAKE